MCHQEYDENLVDCAVREFMEETGLRINVAPGDPFIKINNSNQSIHIVLCRRDRSTSPSTSATPGTPIACSAETFGRLVASES